MTNQDLIDVTKSVYDFPGTEFPFEPGQSVNLQELLAPHGAIVTIQGDDVQYTVQRFGNDADLNRNESDRVIVMMIESHFVGFGGIEVTWVPEIDEVVAVEISRWLALDHPTLTDGEKYDTEATRLKSFIWDPSS